MDASPEQALRDSLKSGDYSDMTIACGDDTYRVHKAIMCPCSKYFETSFKVDMQESHTSHVDLSNHNPDAVKLVIDFFYLADYPPLHNSPAGLKGPTNSEISAIEVAEFDDAPPQPEDDCLLGTSYKSKKGKKMKKKSNLGVLEEPAGPSNAGPEPQSINPAVSLNKTFLLTHCRVYALAEYLQVAELKVLAARKFRAEAEKYWNHQDFFEAVQEVYLTSARGDKLLRDIVVSVMKRHEELLDRFEYQEVVSQLDLAFELLMAVKTNGWG
ncbi:hypothetical protein MCOR10_008444 [Pyricularia oryzae]|nr:hypothetical protein MCOR10_008444 [Pyricularia oryzae]